MLRVRGLRVSHAGQVAVRGVDFELARGDCLALLGRNGSGRSSTLRGLMGLAGNTGSATWQGTELTGLAPHAIARLGVAWLPETRDVFPALTVEENLRLGDRRDTGAWRALLARFPQLAVRADVPAGALSGGERLLLALARALAARPALLLLDEPTEGLAPAMVNTVLGLLRELRAGGISLLIAEQNAHAALQIADTIVVLERGETVWSGAAAAFPAAGRIAEQHLSPL